MTRFAIAVAVALLSAPAVALDVRAVIDGDTFVMDGETIRLWGIDAPELSGDCRFEGVFARSALQTLIQAGGVTCELPPDGQDRDGWRLVRQCWVNGQDVAAELVASGLAVDWPRDSGGAYADEQDAARRARIGMWSERYCRPDWWEGD